MQERKTSEGTAAELVCRHGTALENCSICQSSAHEEFVRNIDEKIEAARPRLLRIARLNGIEPDRAEDVVQETLLEAWRHLEKLQPEHFAAWLDGICRNVCKRHRAQAASLRTSELPTGEDEANAEVFALSDPLAIDPAAELERQDMHILLDRALGYLSESTRELVELCYLTGEGSMTYPHATLTSRLLFAYAALNASSVLVLSSVKNTRRLPA